jgi:uncharacterized protein
VAASSVHGVRRVNVALEPRGVRLDVDVAETRRERVRGLLGRDRLGPVQALLLERTRSVHTIGMRFALTVAFLDRRFRVLEVRRVPPGRVLLPRLRARHVLECAAEADVREDDRVEGYESRPRIST